MTASRKILGLLLSISLLVYVASGLDFEATWQGILAADAGWFLLAFVVFYPGLPLRAWRWQLLLRRVGGDAGILDLSSVLFRAWTLNCALPGRTGDVYAAYLVREEHGFGGSRTAGTIVTSRLLDLLVLVTLVLGLVFSQFRHLTGQSSTVVRSSFVLAFLVVVGPLAVWLTRGMLSRLMPPFVRSRYERVVGGFLTSVTWWRGMPYLLLLTAVLWLLEAARLGCVMKSLGVEPPVAWTIFLALGAAILTVVPITPGGLGTVELFYHELFQVAGIPEHAIGPVVLLDRAINYWFILVAGGVLILVDRRRQRHSGKVTP